MAQEDFFIRPQVEVHLRPLSREESLRRSASAVSFFKASEAINRQRLRRDSWERREAPKAPPVAPEPLPEAQAVAPRVRRSFAEQFGYGVVLKTCLPPKAPEPKPQPRRSGFVGLQAGDTDLLQRLAQRRAASGG